MPRTLKAITGERPRCQFCDKPLRPNTWWFDVRGHITEPPLTAETELPQGYDPNRVFRLTRRLTYLGEPGTRVSFWRGTYGGYGTGQDGTRLFCSYPCGLHFALACGNADMRIKREP
jgi:hypothetical protein